MGTSTQVPQAPTPLTSILGYAELLAGTENVLSFDAQVEAVSVIQRNARRLAALASELQCWEAYLRRLSLHAEAELKPVE